MITEVIVAEHRYGQQVGFLRPDEGPRIFHDAVIRGRGLGVRLAAALLDVSVYVLPPEPDAVALGVNQEGSILALRDVIEG